MADETQSSGTIRSINWREVFPFLHIFRAFRVAVHPSKLVLGLLALLTLYAGGRILDGFWPTGSSANYGEARAYEAFTRGRSTGSFDLEIEKTRDDNRRGYAAALLKAGVVDKPEVATDAAKSFDRAGELRGKINTERDVRIKEADEKYKKDLEEAGKAKSEDQDRLRREARQARQATVTEALAFTRRQLQGLKEHTPRGVFAEFFDYEVKQIGVVVDGVKSNNWTSGMAEGEPGTGVIRATLNFLTVGPCWLIQYHFWYFLIFTALFLLVWAVFGGAICRIAAVHVARDEKISVRQALRFSTNKLLSFVFAPIIPLVIVLVIGLVIAVGGLLLYIPVIGPIVVGAVFFLALIAGVVITLVLLGTAGGFNLMYPTVAVEGSDSFDAISRSFSYVFARPWRMLWYTVVAVAYGALTYLFVRFFIYLVLAVTHFFVGCFLTGDAARWYPEIWPTPNLADLFYDANLSGLKFSEWLASVLIMMWNYLLVGLVGAFAISFYFSSNTIIYYLMRREVDATELDDVYVEESEDDLADAAPITATPAATAPVVAATAPVVTTDAPAASTAPSEPPPSEGSTGETPAT